ncbi:MAG: hypothetical protein NTY64_18900 [Deltaproteobacteria bacterium]|nr:hypothetical protein [Deltaproteobacteria bacterium]
MLTHMALLSFRFSLHFGSFLILYPIHRGTFNIFDGFVKSPSAALRFTFVAAAYHPSTPHSSGFARLASGAFYEAISLATSSFLNVLFSSPSTITGC